MITNGGVVPQSILLVPMAEADAVIDRYRRRLDPSRRYAMPAHVTVLFPFMAPAQISEAVLDELGELFGRCDPFDFDLSEVRWFDDRVVHLAPSPVDRFRELTAAVTAAFPEYPPYEGAFDDVKPHVTVGEDRATAPDAGRGVDGEAQSAHHRQGDRDLAHGDRRSRAHLPPGESLSPPPSRGLREGASGSCFGA